MTDFDTTGSPDADFDARLEGLPPRLRVHEVAKRFDVSSRLLLEALAEGGLTVRTSSASVDVAAARLALIALRDTGRLVVAGVIVDGAAKDAAPVDRPAAAEVVAATPDRTGSGASAEADPAVAVTAEAAPWSPLFAEPDVATAPARPARRRASRPAAPPAPAAIAPVAPAPNDAQNDASGAPAESDDDRYADLPTRMRVHELAKRAGVSAKTLLGLLAERGVVAKSPNSVLARDVAVDLLSALAAPTDDESDDTGAPDTDTSDSASDDGDETGARGRRRRGRRGRSRTGDRRDDGDDAGESPDDDPTGADADGGAHRDEPGADRTDDADETDDADDTDRTDDGDTDRGEGTSRSGRRRRRRGGRGGDRNAEATGTDGTDGTDAEAGRTPAGSGGSATADDTDADSDESRRRRAGRRQHRHRFLARAVAAVAAAAPTTPAVPTIRRTPSCTSGTPGRRAAPSPRSRASAGRPGWRPSGSAAATRCRPAGGRRSSPRPSSSPAGSRSTG